jgi:hypothetical protein
MQSTDRPEFDEQLKILCAGYDKPVGDRSEAYWKGLAKMSLIEFARCVEFCMTEEGPEKMPTAPGMWKIRKQLRSAPTIILPLKTQRHAPDSHMVFFANRLMLRHVVWRGGIGEVELDRCLRAKAELVIEFAGYVREEDELATQGEFIRRFHLELGRVSKMAHEEKWQELIEDPRGKFLFSTHSVEGISPTGSLDL